MELPFRLKAGMQGTWPPGGGVQERRELCDVDRVLEELRRKSKGVTVKTHFLGEVGATDEEGYQGFRPGQVLRFRRENTIEAQQVL